MILTARLENFKIIRTSIMENGNIPDSIRKKLCLAAEEIFVNICSYAYDGAAGSVDFTIEVSDQITMTFQDEGAPFNPLNNQTDTDDYDLDTQIGGLGRLIAFGFADDVTYEYKDSRNILNLFISYDDSGFSEKQRY